MCVAPTEDDAGVCGADIRGKMDIKQEKEFAKLMKERSKAREKLQKMRDQVCDRRLYIRIPVCYNLQDAEGRGGCRAMSWRGLQI